MNIDLEFAWLSHANSNLKIHDNWLPRPNLKTLSEKIKISMSNWFDCQTAPIAKKILPLCDFLLYDKLLPYIMLPYFPPVLKCMDFNTMMKKMMKCKLWPYTLVLCTWS